MAAARKIITAIKVKMMLNRLSLAKENALRELMGLPPKMSWFDECTSTFMTFMKDKLCQTFTPCCVYDRHRRKKRFSCWTGPSFREFLGFLGGIMLTLLAFLVLIYQMDVAPSLALMICAVLGFVLSLTMAFSDNIRCLVLLMLPQFFSGKGRTLLLMYAVFLAMNHPLNNIKVNIGVMAQSATCGQEMALNETMELIKSAVAPMQSVMNSIKEVLSKLVDFANNMKKTYSVLKQTVMEIGSTIKRVGQWLASMVDRCNDKMGAPYKKCKKVFSDGVNSCKEDLGVMSFACDIADTFGVLCNIVRVGELLCLIVDAIKTLIENIIDLPAQRVLSSAQEMFYFNVSIKYHFNYTMSQSKNSSAIREDVSKEIMASLDHFIAFVRFFRNMMTVTVSFILIKAIIYRSKWLSDDRYDNTYITFTVQDLNARREEKNKPGILPLNFDEQQKYIESVSGHMIPKELKQLAFGLVVFIISLFYAAFYLCCDYGLYSSLRLIEANFGIMSRPPVPAHTKMHVAGSGPMADMYRSIIGMFDPLSDSSNSKVDVAPCVPHPSEPDWSIYKLIGAIYLVCLILTITKAYGLRLRHLIMACYFPRRERKRAIWLFNHILNARGGILKGARTTMKKTQMGEADVQHISLKGRLAASFPICEKILKWLGWSVKCCLYCGREGKPDDYLNFFHCAFFDCDAVYCIDCYADLDNICAVCNNAVEMKGAEDSEEVDSSVDERQKLVSERQKKVRQDKIENIKAARSPSNILANIRAEFGGIGNEMDLNSSAAVDLWYQRKKARRRRRAYEISSARMDSNSCAVDITGRRSRRNRQIPTTPISNYEPIGSVRNSNNSKTKCQSKNTCQRRHLNKKGQKTRYVASKISDQEISSGSSIDSDDLDYDYQYSKRAPDSDNDMIDFRYRRHGQHKLDLVSKDIFSDSSSDSDSNDSSDAFLSEPTSIVISRE